MNITREQVEREVRFFLFMEEDPYHGVIFSPRVVAALLSVALVFAFYIAFLGFVVYTVYGILGFAGIYVLVILAIIQPAHYLCDRKKTGKPDEKYDGKHQQTGREAGEALLA